VVDWCIRVAMWDVENGVETAGWTIFTVHCEQGALARDAPAGRTSRSKQPSNHLFTLLLYCLLSSRSAMSDSCAQVYQKTSQ
jgi:hypothetical protein